jgi:hypothetical protein
MLRIINLLVRWKTRILLPRFSRTLLPRIYLAVLKTSYLREDINNFEFFFKWVSKLIKSKLEKKVVSITRTYFSEV